MTATINASTTAGVVTTADTSGILQLQTNGTAALTVDASQNVGIGTASPTAKLHVAGTIRATSGGATTPAVTVTQGYINGDISSSNFSIGNYGDSSSEMRIDTRGFTTFYTGATNNATGSERARIDSSGNVGIGTSSPNSRLEALGSTAGAEISRFEGNYSASGTVNLTNWRRSGGAVASVMRYNDANTDMEFGTTTSHSQAFITSGTERARIDSSGNLLVGTTSAYVSSRFRVKSSGTTSATYNTEFDNSAGTVLFAVRDDGYFFTGVAANSPYNITTGSAANCFINSDGGLYRSTSSLKYKTNVQDASHGLADVLKLRAVTYSGKGDVDIDKVFGGLIAEEVHEAGLTEFVQYAEDGSPDALNYGNMVSVLIKAIQELKAIVDGQAVLIAAQGAEIAALKGATA